MNEEIKKEFEKTFRLLSEALLQFDNKQFNKAAFEGSWTAGQVSEHLLKSDLSGLLYGNLEDTDRNPDEKVKKIRDIFLNFDTKMKNPDFNNPGKKSHNLEDMKKSFEKIFSKVQTALNTQDLNKLCSDFQLPNMGKLTGLEWMYFMAYHFQRHTHQIKKIHETLSA